MWWRWEGEEDAGYADATNSCALGARPAACIVMPHCCPASLAPSDEKGIFSTGYLGTSLESNIIWEHDLKRDLMAYRTVRTEPRWTRNWIVT